MHILDTFFQDWSSDTSVCARPQGPVMSGKTVLILEVAWQSRNSEKTHWMQLTFTSNTVNYGWEQPTLKVTPKASNCSPHQLGCTELLEITKVLLFVLVDDVHKKFAKLGEIISRNSTSSSALTISREFVLERLGRTIPHVTHQGPLALEKLLITSTQTLTLASRESLWPSA